MRVILLFGAVGVRALISTLEFPEDKSTYDCHSEIKWPDAPPREHDGSKLDKVLVFARHGARTPLYDMTCWANDEARYTCPTKTFAGFADSPSGGRSPGFSRLRGKKSVLPGDGCLLGQLVDAGVQMHMANGKQLGAAYKSVLGLPDIPKEPEVMFRSTDVPRVHQSAEALAMGLFPKIVHADDSKLSIIMPDRQRDTLMPNPSVCPRLNDALNEFYNSPTAKERAQKTTDLREFIGAATCRSKEFNTNNTRAMKDLFDPLHDCLTAHVCSTVPSEPKNVPKGLEESGTVFKAVEKEAVFWALGRYGVNKEMKKLAYGPFIGDLLEDLGVRDRRLSVYLGHDMGPAHSIIDALELTWMDSGNTCAESWPPFGCTLVMEIYSDNQARFVYNGRVASVEAIEGCRGKYLCPLDELHEYLVTLVPTESECEGRN
ncbi:Prostatic acid phosphatase precursor, putative [Perkinsus marinus ATCC 50983]|uniref:Prostatic acid phosphatase, putative n=1 Tax=Perkinsus marinus (strain ATCC 50983 / TXsc) TaxID=423536 RepID=C5LSI0_PERM5|nr:Prostatic acid phosphatase precursor, putative [Perkinsus marinus ATCC 50983]EER00221.1 Prostatic acid phosphatase precursor, putative [Perkinsus marinus ATCC 50983]|eukprot:XP_002767503.1 Prostatic acid phosphatase precursor, putative [Perkinsus marinus ATCC 50983]